MNTCRCKRLDCCDIKWVLDNAECCRLGVCERNQPCIIAPMDFTYDECDGCFYFRLEDWCDSFKMECIPKNPKVCLQFEIDCEDGLRNVVAFGIAKVKKQGCCCEDRVICVKAHRVIGRLYYSENSCECDCNCSNNC